MEIICHTKQAHIEVSTQDHMLFGSPIQEFLNFHQSSFELNEGLALQARVSGPWPHKKESVLQVKLALWQGVQVQTVVDRV